MHIIIQHHLPLPIKGYGGTERIVFWHMKELARMGHRVTFIGPKESQVTPHGIHHIPLDRHQLDHLDLWTPFIPKDADILHLNYNASHPTLPTISTVHGNGKPGEVFHKNSVFVSNAHAKLHGGEVYVYNALNFSEYPISITELKEKNFSTWNQFLFLAKASWKVKNLTHAIQACRTHHKHLQVAGGRYFGLSRYIHSHGIIDGDQKLKLLKQCQALLFPVRWPEPFGIAIIEAMAMGLPVIGSPYGSLPELITSRDVGLIANNHFELAEAVKTLPHSFHAPSIRSYAESHFSIQTYSEKYLELYNRILKGENLHQNPLTLQSKNRAETLLPY